MNNIRTLFSTSIHLYSFIEEECIYEVNVLFDVKIFLI